MTTINTAKVAGRRTLRFESLDEIVTDVERLAACKELRSLGNWSPGQVLQHLATTMNGSIDGFPNFVPAPMKLLLRVFMKRRFLTKPMPPGFQLPKKAGTLHPRATKWDAALANFREAMRRLKSETRRSPHPAFGPMTADEWEKIHCRHSELHLSFLVPVES
jgi:hypothetical protein